MAIKDTLPYLLGAVQEDRLALAQEERELKRRLRVANTTGRNAVRRVP
jgi:hypothetical protein